MSEELMERCPRKPGTPLGKGMMVPGGPDSKKGKGGQGASKGKGKGQATGQGKGTSRGGNKK